MERQIKFRAYLPGNKLIGNVITLEGSNNGYKFHKVTAECFENGRQQFYSSYEFILMQFTGLLDKNGVEIYEGDIVKTSTDKLMQISWSKRFASFVIDRKGWMFSHWFGEAFEGNDCEVVGNIYSNPELLP